MNKNHPRGVLAMSEMGGYDCGGPLVAAVVFFLLVEVTMPSGTAIDWTLMSDYPRPAAGMYLVLVRSAYGLTMERVAYVDDEWVGSSRAKGNIIAYSALPTMEIPFLGR